MVAESDFLQLHAAASPSTFTSANYTFNENFLINKISFQQLQKTTTQTKKSFSTKEML